MSSSQRRMDAFAEHDAGYEAYIRAIVDSIPPITDEQRAAITAVLSPGAVIVPEPRINLRPAS